MDIKKLTKEYIRFRDVRDWKQFHNPKDMALSMTLEATEVLEHFQWKNKEEIEDYVKKNKDKIAEEMADVLSWILIMSHDLKIDIIKSAYKKIKQNSKKYPISKAKGNAKKYTEYQ
jgi:dCTP diphosphatase